jgi:hypothetical protein
VITRRADNVNYVNTFIAVADDFPVEKAAIPPGREGKTSIADVQYAMLVEHPYRHRQDDILFASSAGVRGVADLKQGELAGLREAFFAKPQACLRTSPLAKRYGWGVHFDAEAAYPVESDDYQRLHADASLHQLTAMRSKRG